MNYIDRIKQLKSEKKITNDKLAEITGIPLGTLSKILAGMNDSPKLANIIAISNALDCSIDYLVNGTPQNNNNFKLDEEEISFVKKFRELDSCGKDIAKFVVEREFTRISEARSVQEDVVASHKKAQNVAKVLDPADVRRKMSEVAARRSIALFDMPVSAGTGVYLDEESAERINIPDNEKTRCADFALRISGNSMEPKYHNGDIILVERSEIFDVGELGIFVLDGQGYFKQYGGDRLISLNPEFEDILLKNFSEVVCCGKVVGKLKKR
ncbi:MAG: LexA family transcriptional regulator [Clostridia bacterium]|nr:LexA family transcriptional regulator [Clostridia bacterium]